MLKIRNWSLAVALLTGACFAQEAVPQKFYKLDFVVKEVEGARVLNARAYSITGSSTTDRSYTWSIRTGTRVPFQVGGSPSGQINYLDVGVSIDCHTIKELPNGLSLTVSADISSIPQESTQSAVPVVRQNRWVSNVVVPLRKPLVIFSSDDLTTKHQMQLELTATPIS